ncbi:hypothetical protein EDD16DRAFT_1898001 [Pisolithus croceorrhizus]|nr:hypothetical protein EDD16DRAFT_1898001 [Pisolithus croceorrhizus]
MTRSTASAERDGGGGIFRKDGEPVRFCFDRSVREGTNRIIEDIVTNGGVVAEDDQDADVVLVDEEANIDIIRRRYYSSEDPHRRRMFVERRGFVKRCVRSGVYEHRNPNRRQGMPGPRPLQNGGRTRVYFTGEDDDHLAYYLATIFPDEEAGGRLGNFHYKVLVQLGAQFPEYIWAARHTWHSWRERYKKNRDYFDPIIAKIAETLQDGHGHGHEHRSRKYKGIRSKSLDLEDEEEEEEEEEGGGRKNATGAAREYLCRNEDELIAFETEEETPMGGEMMADARARPAGKHGHCKSDARSPGIPSPRKRARLSQSSKFQTSCMRVPSNSDEEDSLPSFPPPHQALTPGDDKLFDSDDAETHRNLQRSALSSLPLEEEAKFLPSSDDSVPEFEEDDVAIKEKLERMRHTQLTRSVQDTSSRAYLQPQGHSIGYLTASITPRHGRHSQELNFPSPGTKARKVVDQMNLEKKKQPYIPPAGSHAARLKTARI